MNTGKVIGMVLFLLIMAGSTVAQEARAPKAAPVPEQAPAPMGLVIGGNLKVGMPLNEAINLLGIPQSIKVNRGPVYGMDSVAIDYQNHGLVIHALSSGSQVEGIEIGPHFKGTFESGIRLGDNFPSLVDKYGVPQSMTAQVARYPERGLYFLMNNDILLSAKTYSKDTKLVDAKLMNP